MMYRHILVAMALDHGVSGDLLSIARGLLAEGGSITAIHVIEPPRGTAVTRLREDLLEEGKAKVRALFAEKLAGASDVSAHIVEGHIARSITDYAGAEAVDCIVMGSHHPGLTEYFLGSTAARVVRHAPCSVHVYRGA